MPIDHRAIAKRFVASVNAREPEALVALLADDFVEEWPQSGERVVGRDNLARILFGHPDRPSVRIGPRVSRLDHRAWAVEALLDYRGTPVWEIARFEVHDDGRIRRVVTYFGDPFEPAPHRAPFVRAGDPLALDPEDPAPAAADEVGRDLVLAYARAATRGDEAALRELAHPDWQGVYPQSGERFVGMDAVIRAHEHHPGGLPEGRVIGVAGAGDRWTVTPMFTPLLVSGSGAVWLGEAALRYADGSRWFLIDLVTFRAGRAWRDRTYYCLEFEAPAWRSQWVERFDPLSGVG